MLINVLRYQKQMEQLYYDMFPQYFRKLLQVLRYQFES